MVIFLSTQQRVRWEEWGGGTSILFQGNHPTPRSPGSVGYVNPLAQKQAFCLAGYLQPNKEWLSRLLIAYLSSSPLKLFLLASSKPAAEVKLTPPPLSLWCLMSPIFVFPVCLGFCLSFIMPVEIIYLLLWGVSVTLVYLNFPSFLSPLEFKIWNHIYKYTVLPSLCVFIFIVALSIR